MIYYALQFLLWMSIFLGLFGIAFLVLGNFTVASHLFVASVAICFLGDTIAYVSDKRRKSK